MKRTKPIPKRRSKPRCGPDRDEKYLAFIRTLPCVVCTKLAITQQHAPTEAAHTGPHGMAQKAADDQALPLCARHHRLGNASLHRLGKLFWDFHKADRDKLVAHYQAEYYRLNPPTFKLGETKFVSVAVNEGGKKAAI